MTKMKCFIQNVAYYIMPKENCNRPNIIQHSLFICLSPDIGTLSQNAEYMQELL